MRKRVFINPFVDRGFKILFGQESSKELLIGLLNDMLEGERHIRDLHFLDKEVQAVTTDGRGVIFDLECEDEDGTIFIVELQNAAQPYFYERGLFYLSHAVVRQGEKGADWKFKLCPVYGIFILNFRSGRTEKVRTDIVLADREDGKQMSNILREIFIEMPLFTKTESECETPLDYWLYNLKYMEQLETLSFKGQRELFNHLEKLAKIANMNKRERAEYEACLKVYRDNKNIEDYRNEQLEEKYKEGREKGLKEGLKEGALAKARNIARSLKQNGFSTEQIQQYTGLAAEEINRL